MFENYRTVGTHVSGGENGARDFAAPFAVLGVGAGGEDI